MNLLIVGAGGHTRSCIDVIHASNRFTIQGLIGLGDQVGQTVLGYKVIGSDNDLALFRSDCEFAFIGIGQIKTASVRQNIFSNLRDLGYTFPTFVSSRAYVSPFASLSAGTIVMPGGIIGPGAKVGENCIINSQALIEHDAVVGDHCHISTGARINGRVTIDGGSFIGSGSILREGVKVGKNSLVGAGQTVLKDVPANSIVKGLP
jgi:sugar O-acyltransferase (sialic acid O-acetyltransferase NeuD family)